MGFDIKWRRRIQLLIPDSAMAMYTSPCHAVLIFQYGFQSMLRCPPSADLMHTLWEADVTVFKAHITTNPASDVLDMFWIYDNRHELPDHHRQAVRTCLLRLHATCSS